MFPSVLFSGRLLRYDREGARQPTEENNRSAEDIVLRQEQSSLDACRVILLWGGGCKAVGARSVMDSWSEGSPDRDDHEPKLKAGGVPQAFWLPYDRCIHGRGSLRPSQFQWIVIAL